MKHPRLTFSSEMRKDLLRAIHDPLTTLRLNILQENVGDLSSIESRKVDAHLQRVEVEILQQVENVLGHKLLGHKPKEVDDE